MNDKELLNIWESYDQKLDGILSINKQIIRDMTKNNLNDAIISLRWPKQKILIIGMPYTVILYMLTFIAYNAGGLFVTIGFGAISVIMTAIILGYFYHLYLIKRISHSQDIIDVQSKMARLKISSFNITRLAVIQLPFWSICWISSDALMISPILYGGVNLIVFVGLSYISYWLYKNINIQNIDSKVNRFFMSGNEWDPILKASKILDQLEEYEN